MKDHAKPLARLAVAKPRVCVEQPDWTKELLMVFAAVAAGAFALIAASSLVSLDELRAARAEAAHWKARAHERDTLPTVRFDPKQGYRCSSMNIRREWEVAVAAECQVMGSLLQVARAAP